MMTIAPIHRGVGQLTSSTLDNLVDSFPVSRNNGGGLLLELAASLAFLIQDFEYRQEIGAWLSVGISTSGPPLRRSI